MCRMLTDGFMFYTVRWDRLGEIQKITLGQATYPVLHARLNMSGIFTFIGFGASIVFFVAALIVIGWLSSITGEKLIGGVFIEYSFSAAFKVCFCYGFSLYIQLLASSSFSQGSINHPSQQSSIKMLMISQHLMNRGYDNSVLWWKCTYLMMDSWILLA